MKLRLQSSDNNTVVLKGDQSEEILALKTELEELKGDQTTVTTTQGQGTDHRLFNKRRHDDGDLMTDKSTVDVYKDFLVVRILSVS